MTFIPRHPVVENQFMKHQESSPTVEAGQICHIVDDYEVAVISGTDNVPFGFFMQKVRAPYTELPAHMLLRTDMGSSDTFKGNPVAIAHSGGVYDTDQYEDSGGSGISAGDKLYPNADGMLDTVSGSGSFATAIAVAMNSLTTSQISAGKMLRVKILI